MENKEYTIDANGKSVGRVAQEVASILRGKNSPSFAPNKLPNVKVTVTNASKAKISLEKKEDKTYTRYTGYPGGLREESLGKMIEKKGYGEVFKKAVYGMLPSNRLRSQAMKNLIITE